MTTKRKKAGRRPAPRFDLIPSGPLARLAARYELGLRLYGKDAWKAGLDMDDALNHAVEHLLAHRDRTDRHRAGERPDPRLADDDLSAIAWAAFTMMAYQERE